MKTFTKFAAAAAMTIATFGAVSSASALTFVDIAVSGAPGNNQIAWDGTTKTLTITDLLTTLNFDNDLFNDGAGQDAVFNLTATTTDGLTLNGPTFTQTGLSGTFEFRTADLSTVLLSGTFSSYWMQGVANLPLFTSGNVTAVGGTADFYSEVVALSGIVQDNFGLTFSNVMSGPTAGFIIEGGELQSFEGSSVAGTFGGAIPEPGTWALMILGFGGAGAMIRSRRRVAFA
jgi:hypothetical protein